MAKKSPKKQFDWKTYSKPARLLSESQEASLSDGVLAPLLQLALTEPDLRMEIRARSANLYYRGASLMRLAGDSPFFAEFESSEGAPPRRDPLESPDDVTRLIGRLAEMRAEIDATWDTDKRSERDVLQAVASSNDGDDLFLSEYLVLDLEYTYGRRRYDLVALRRVEGVTGPGGFAHGRLTFVDVRTAGQSLTGAAGLDAVASDLAEFAKALGGSHLERAREEFVELAAQKVRLGLLPAELEVREVSGELPELLVLFAGFDVADSSHDAAIVALHEKLASRHYPTELLRFAHLAEAPASPDESLVLGEDDVMSYREFKDYRKQLA